MRSASTISLETLGADQSYSPQAAPTLAFQVHARRRLRGAALRGAFARVRIEVVRKVSGPWPFTPGGALHLITSSCAALIGAAPECGHRFGGNHEKYPAHQPVGGAVRVRKRTTPKRGGGAR